MDYKYIEQLLERYWTAETTLEEEKILQAFFAQRELPEHLALYQPIFATFTEERQEQLSADFDARLMKRIAPQPKLRLSSTMKRVYAVAASLAVFFLVGISAQYIYKSTEPQIIWDYSLESFKDSYDNPEIALDESVDALLILQEQLQTIVNVDTTKVTSMK